MQDGKLTDAILQFIAMSTSENFNSKRSTDHYPHPHEPLIAIVGAGLAGLASAAKLIELGHENLIIIEAANCVGGRVESCPSEDGARLDFGPQWLHGERGNPIYSWLEEMNLIDQIEDEEVEFEGLFRTQLGLAPKPNLIVEKCLEVLLDSRQMLYKASGSLDELRLLPADVYRKQLCEARLSNRVLKEAEPRLIESILSWFLLYETIDNSCENISNLSLRAYSNWTNFDEGKMVKLRGGWSGVRDKLVSLVGDQRKFLLNSPVSKIIYSNKHKTLIDFSTGNSKNSIEVDYVIVTCSVGVLKANARADFFEPRLESWRVETIERIGFGVVDKIFLRFEQPFLQEERGLKLLWLNGKEEEVEGEKLPGWVRFMTGFDLVDRAPCELVAWIGGRGAREMELERDDEYVRQVCSRVVKLFLPEKKVPNLISIKRSRWASREFIKGSYSYPSVDADVDDQIKNGKINSPSRQQRWWSPVLADGGKLKLLFAGEATAELMYATAHGAIVSGWREAKRLHDSLTEQEID